MNSSANLLLLAGIKEELKAIFDEIPFDYSKELRAYRSQLHHNIYAVTLGPGLKKKSELASLIARIKPEMVINAGLVGLLNERSKLPIGARVHPAFIGSSQGKTGYNLTGRDEGLITVAHPVFEPDEKNELALRFQAGFCDMEAYPLIEFISSQKMLAETNGIKLIFCKVIGDRPEHYPLFRHEALMRGFSQKSLVARLVFAVGFPGGIYNLVKLIRIKQKALKSLGKEVKELIKEILSSAKNTDKLDNTLYLK